ncbi:methyltransferase domain-containing protein [Roseibium sp. RKSG952]|uniref:methyltransferase domain-containing protein n=1 Tax=Roseibium sp. RKSG952 TaxID=2529384 RepID=UPI0012BD362D|nr:methyltransferase domain-containing protein [Roseibium sp. RKSG952]MTH99258.1 methyltransferase domain-containing protein [Roseibium sp. RKSG952]
MSQVELFDRKLLQMRRQRALKAFQPGADFLVSAVAADLADRLIPVNRTFDTAIDLGGHNDDLARMIIESGKVAQLYRGHLFFANPHGRQCDFVFDDAFPPLGDETVSLIISPLTLQFVNDLPGTLIQLRRALKPDGLLLATLPGADTLHELRDVLMRAELETTGGASIRVAPFADTRDLGALLQRAGFALPVTDKDTLTVRYDNMFALLKDLRAMGATAALNDRPAPLKRSTLLRAAELYAQDYADPDGRIRASFDMITLSGWAPHESQQKPLTPGSAKMSLKDVL